MKHASEETPTCLQNAFAAHFGGAQAANDRPFVLASAPGRVELAGNHTDHQGGCTISAAVDLRMHAIAAENGTDEIRLLMDGFGTASMHVSDLDVRASEQGTPLSLVRGMTAAYVESGNPVRGFDMATCSDVPVGAGISSSAAFEVLVGAVIRTLFDPDAGKKPLDPIAIALDGVRAERVYFGKPCGAQDQIACAYGGIVGMDFATEIPRITPIALDADAFGWKLLLIDSRCDHSRYADEYAAVPADMHAVARHFACKRLEEVPFGAFLEAFPQVRMSLGDRAALRALHYFEETRRVREQQRALQSGDFASFIEYARQSGASSAQILQNVSPACEDAFAERPAATVLALCAHLIDGSSTIRGCKEAASTAASARSRRGAYRIHGGGFGGSVLAFVPDDEAQAFKEAMDALLGYDACMRVSVSPLGVCAERTAR